MSKATIIANKQDGLYTVEENFNTEVIEFNIERLRLRRSDIFNTDLPQAEQDLTDAEAALSVAIGRMEELMKELGGQPSAALLAALNAATSDLNSADTTLSLVQTDILNVDLDVSDAQGHLPPGPPQEVLDAFTLANNALTTADMSRFTQQQDLHIAQGYLSTVLTDVNANPPDLTDAQNQLNQFLIQMQTVESDHLQTVSDLNFAKGKIQAARNILPGDASYDASRADLDAALAYFDAHVTPDHSGLSALYSDAKNKAISAQDLLTPGRDAVRQELKKALKDLNDARTAQAQAQFTVDSLEFELQEIIRKIDELDAIPKKAVKDLWCADLTDNIPVKTEVGIMPVPGELNKFRGTADLGDEAVIRAAFNGQNHLWNQKRDGWITPCQALTPSAVFWNLAMTPGWQVFKPTFRFATVLAVNGDGTLKLALIQPNISSQQLLDVTPKDIPSNEFTDPQEITYEAVKVKYMDCDAGAFITGDEVVIQYVEQKAIEPLVIGFRNHPRGCRLGLLAPGKVAQYDTQAQPPQWRVQGKAGLIYGRIFWISRVASVAVSWAHFNLDTLDFGWFFAKPEEALVYVQGSAIDTPGPTCGGCIFKKADGSQRLRIAVWVIDPDTFAVTGFDFYDRAFPILDEVWIFVGHWESEPGDEINSSILGERPGDVRFNELGNRAVWNLVNGLACKEYELTWDEFTFSAVKTRDLPNDDPENQDYWRADYYLAPNGSNDLLRFHTGTASPGGWWLEGPFDWSPNTWAPETTDVPTFVDLRLGLWLGAETGYYLKGVNLPGQPDMIATYNVAYGVDMKSLHIALEANTDPENPYTYLQDGDFGILGVSLVNAESVVTGSPIFLGAG